MDLPIFKLFAGETQLHEKILVPGLAQLTAESTAMQAQVQQQRRAMAEVEQQVTKAVAKVSAWRATVTDIDASMRGAPVDALTFLQDVAKLESDAVRLQ